MSPIGDRQQNLIDNDPLHIKTHLLSQFDRRSHFYINVKIE